MRQLAVLGAEEARASVLVAALARRAGRALLVDARLEGSPGRRLIDLLEGTLHHREIFWGGSHLALDRLRCTACGDCLPTCPTAALVASHSGDAPPIVDVSRCTLCGACLPACPVEALAFVPRATGEWALASTAAGPLVAGYTSGLESNSSREALRARLNEVSRELSSGAHFPLALRDEGAALARASAPSDLVLVVAAPGAQAGEELALLFDECAALGRRFALVVRPRARREREAEELALLARRRGALASYELAEEQDQESAALLDEMLCLLGGADAGEGLSA